MKNPLLEHENKLSNNFILEMNGDFVALTSENVAKVEAMIKTNSSYRNSSDITKKIVYKIPKGQKHKEISYNGSSAFWFSVLKKMYENNLNIITINNIKCGKNFISETYKYIQVLEHCIIAVDSENSTHLNSDQSNLFTGSRYSVAKRIEALGVKKLFKSLENENDYTLISAIQGEDATTGAKLNNLNKENNHFSFATKFCHNACVYLADNKNKIDPDRFSKYDTILEKELPRYCEKYSVKMDIDLKKEKDKLSKNGKSAQFYIKYIGYIESILNKAEKKNNGERISRRGFDHLIWYTYKGN